MNSTMSTKANLQAAQVRNARGYVQIIEPAGEHPLPNSAHIAWIQVKPAARRQGVATDLLKQALARLRHQGITHVEAIPVDHGEQLFAKLVQQGVLKEVGFDFVRPENTDPIFPSELTQYEIGPNLCQAMAGTSL